MNTRSGKELNSMFKEINGLRNGIKTLPTLINPSTQGRGWQISEFEANTVYRSSSRTAKLR